MLPLIFHLMGRVSGLAYEELIDLTVKEEINFQGK